MTSSPSVHDLHAAFCRALARVGVAIPVPKQSRGKQVRYPGSSIAACAMGVDRTHLHRVLTGERQSKSLVARWHAWLKANPEFAALSNRKPS